MGSTASSCDFVGGWAQRHHREALSVAWAQRHYNLALLEASAQWHHRWAQWHHQVASLGDLSTIESSIGLVSGLGSTQSIVGGLEHYLSSASDSKKSSSGFDPSAPSGGLASCSDGGQTAAEALKGCRNASMVACCQALDDRLELGATEWKGDGACERGREKKIVHH